MSEVKIELTESKIYDIYYKKCVDAAVENKIISPLMPLVASGIASEGPFGDFLLKGIYDPRLLVTIFHMANDGCTHGFSERMIFRHFLTLYECATNGQNATDDDKNASNSDQTTNNNGKLITNSDQTTSDDGKLITNSDQTTSNNYQNTNNSSQTAIDNKKFVLELLRLDKELATSVLNRTRIMTNDILLIASRWNIAIHKIQNVKYFVTDIAESLVYNPIYLRFAPHLADKKHYEAIFHHHGLWFIGNFDQKVYDYYVEYAKAHNLVIRFNMHLLDNYVGKVLELSKTNQISHATLKEMDNQITDLFINIDSKCEHTILADVVIACDDCTDKIMNFEAKSCIAYSDIDTWFGEKKPYDDIIKNKSHLLPYYMNVWNRLTNQCNYANYISQASSLIRSILHKFDVVPYPRGPSSWEENLKYYLANRPFCTDYSFIVHENPRIKELAQYDIYAIMKDLEKGINKYNIYPEIEFVDGSSEFKDYYENEGKITYELLLMYAKKVDNITNIKDTIVRLYINQRCAEIIRETGVFPRSSYVYVEWLLNKCDNPANFAASILYSYCLCREHDYDIITYLADFIADHLDVYRTSHAHWIELRKTIAKYIYIPDEKDFIMRRLFDI